MLVACLLNLVKRIILQVTPFPCLCTREFCKWALQCGDMREVATNIVDIPEELLKLLFTGGCGEIGNMRYFFFGWCILISFDCDPKFQCHLPGVTFIHPEIEVVFLELFEYLPKVVQVIIIGVWEYEDIV